MADERIAVTVMDGPKRFDFAVQPDTRLVDVVSAVDPSFRGTVGLTSGEALSSSGAIGEQVESGSVLILGDDGRSAADGRAARAGFRLRLRLPAAPGSFVLRLGVSLVAAVVLTVVLGQTLDLQWRVGLLLALWLATVGASLGWAWSRQRHDAMAAVCLGVIAAAVTALTIPAGAISGLTPLVLALVVASVAAAPVLAPRVPTEQLLDLPLLATSALSTRAAQVHSPGRVTDTRATLVVKGSDATVTVITVLGSLAAIILAWLVMWSGASAGPRAWASLGTVLLSALILTVAPTGSVLRTARLVPRAAAVVVTLELAWHIALRGAGGVVVPVWALVMSLACLAVLAVSISLVSTSQQGAPLVGRIGDITLALSQVILFPAAFLASSVFWWLWRGTL
ncbi:MAG: hypothetical protein FWF36_04945 [Propionibacteriaceae bacterium]|nr:hypothetical protein [Propionibacteriaceae bacterium]